MFHVTTRRGKQFNTLIYAEVDPLTGAARDAVLMSADDAAGTARASTGIAVTLVNDAGRYRRARASGADRARQSAGALAGRERAAPRAALRPLRAACRITTPIVRVEVAQ